MTLQTRISLDHLHCYDEADGIGSGEPYLWTVFFKVDGDTVVLDLIGDPADDDQKGPEDVFLRGTCTVATTAGSHGNLGDRDVDAGDDVAIPSALGDFETSLRPIPVTDRARSKIPVLGDTYDGGTVGVVVVLMEENAASNADAEAGHAELNACVEQGINEKIPELGFEKQEVTDEDIAELTARCAAAVEAAITDALSAWATFSSLFNAEVKIGSTVFKASQTDLLNDANQEQSARLQRVVPTGNGQAVVAEDYKISGEILGVEPSPLGYRTVPRSQEYGTPAASGAPTALAIPALGVQNIVYRDTRGRLHELWRDAAGQTGTTNLTAVANAPTATGNPHTYVDTTTGQEILLYRGSDANVHSLYWSTGAVGHDDLTGSVGAPKSDGNPVGYFTPATNTHHVLYRKGDGHLHVLWWAGAEAVSHDDATALAGAPPAAGDPSAYLDTTRGVNIVVYRATDGHIHDIYWAGGDALADEDLSGVAGTPPAVGDPVAYYTARDDVHQVTYRSGDGHLHELWWLGITPVSGWDLTAIAGAPEAVSDPAAYYSAGTNTKHVIYRSENEHLNEIWWVPGSGTPAHVDLTLMALARRAADKPAAFTVEGPNTQHVVYRGTDDQIHEIRWPEIDSPAPAQIGFSPDSLDFGLLGIGEVAVRRLHIWNAGAVPVVVTVPSNRGGGFFSWQALPATTVPASGIDLEVEFSPLGAGAARGVLTLEGTALGSPHAIALSGKGRAETPN